MIGITKLINSITSTWNVDVKLIKLLLNNNNTNNLI